MSDAQAYGLSASDLTELMPFHIVFDRSLRVLQRGRVLARCCPGLGIGAQLPDHFRLVRPDRAFDESALSTPDAGCQFGRARPLMRRSAARLYVLEK